MKKNKMILNIKTKEEKSVYFDNFTKKRLNEMLNADNYVLLYYDTFFKSYIAYDFKGKKQIKNYFNNNIEKYVY